MCGRPQNGVPATSSFSSRCVSRRSAIVLHPLTVNQRQDAGPIGGLKQDLRLIQQFHVLVSHIVRKIGQILFSQSAEEEGSEDAAAGCDHSVEGQLPKQALIIANQPDPVSPGIGNFDTEAVSLTLPAFTEMKKLWDEPFKEPLTKVSVHGKKFSLLQKCGHLTMRTETLP